MLRMLDLCSGIGGASLAASWAGIEVTGFVEIDPFCQAVLAKHWPSVKCMADIREVKGHEFGEVDIIAAGFPCQPNSVAGKRQGSQDERNLWPEVRRIIGTTQPRWFVGENVCGLLTVESRRFFGSILSDLVSLGYSPGWAVYGACEVGAPHRRERVFIVAYLPGIGGHTRGAQPAGQQWTPHIDGNGSSDVAHPCSSGQQERDMPTITSQESHVAWSDVAHSTGRREWKHQISRGEERPQSLDFKSGERQPKSRVCREFDGLPTGLHGHQWPAGPGEPQHDWEPPRVTIGKQQDRAKRLKALGNSIVPQQIYPIFKQIAEWEGKR